MKESKSCEIACVVTLNKVATDGFLRAIDEDYRVHWIVDNLPVGVQGEDSFQRGFPVGFKIGEGDNVKRYLNNHIRIILQYHDNEAEEGELTGSSKIVGFRVEPLSIRHTANLEDSKKGGSLSSCANAEKNKNYQIVKKGENIAYTYDVVWEESDVEWINRWDTYILNTETTDKVHWFSITNSIMIVLFLSVMVAMILIRALRKDIASYNSPESLEENKEESGWKMVHGDVFRPPSTFPMLLSVFVGTGVQLFCMSVATLSFTLLGLLSPENRGSLTTAFILLFVFMGSFAGYNSSSIYKMFRGTEWQRTTILTAFFFPGVIFVVYFTLNFALLMEGSSGAIPLATFFTLLFLWFCVSVPLVFIGSYFGYRKEVPTHPVRTNQIPRLIPTQQWYLHPFITIALGGILPFGAVSVELFFILSALWLHQIYYIFGFLFLVMIVLIVTCAEISILLCYFHLCAEDYHWWWRSFLTAGSCAGYTLLYSVWYYLTKLDMTEFLPTLIYFGYMSIVSLTFFLITGTIGFYSCFWFNTQIYGSIKVD
jgi:transmembrane 9 superfamily member 2/4